MLPAEWSSFHFMFFSSLAVFAKCLWKVPLDIFRPWHCPWYVMPYAIPMSPWRPMSRMKSRCSFQENGAQLVLPHRWIPKSQHGKPSKMRISKRPVSNIHPNVSGTFPYLQYLPSSSKLSNFSIQVTCYWNDRSDVNSSCQPKLAAGRCKDPSSQCPCPRIMVNQFMDGNCSAQWRHYASSAQWHIYGELLLHHYVIVL